MFRESQYTSHNVISLDDTVVTVGMNEEHRTKCDEDKKPLFYLREKGMRLHPFDHLFFLLFSFPGFQHRNDNEQ